MASMRSVRLIITGRVQGVGFRAFVAHQAQARGLCGWVRNRRDGAVEAAVSGEADLVARMIADIWNGPGRVDKVEAEDLAAATAERSTLQAGFSIRPTL